MPIAPQIIITRPAESAQRSIDFCEQHQLHYIHEPLTLVVKRPIATADITDHLLNDRSIFITTSKHAITALAEATNTRDITLFVLGAASQSHAETLGFSNIISAEGNSESLLERICDYYSNIAEKPVHAVYLRGVDISRELAADIAATGCEYHEIICYEAVETSEFSTEMSAALYGNRPLAVLLYSQRNAAIFESLVKTQSPTGETCQLHALCLSEEIMQSLSPKLWFKRQHTTEINEQSLLDRLLEMRY